MSQLQVECIAKAQTRIAPSGIHSQNQRNEERNMRNRNIGSISSGTMRPQDVIPAMLWEAEHNKLTISNRQTIRKIAARVRKVQYGRFGDDDAYWTDEVADWDRDSLENILSECAPPYFYFGAHPGDGADLGYWLDESFQNEFDGLKVDDLSKVPTGYTGEVLHINDHGNMSLYRAVRGRLYELWSIV